MQESVVTKSDTAAAMPTVGKRALVDALTTGDLRAEGGMIRVTDLAAWARAEAACQVVSGR